jgi:hypothetical protein
MISGYLLMAGQSRDRIPVGVRFSAPSRVALEPTHSSVQWVPGPFPRDEAAGCGVDHSPPSSTEFKERAELYLYSASGSSWPILGCALTLFYVSACRVQILHPFFKYYYNYKIKIPRLNPPASPVI